MAEIFLRNLKIILRNNFSDILMKCCENYRKMFEQLQRNFQEKLEF